MVTKLKNNKKALFIILYIFVVTFGILIPLGFAAGEDSSNVLFDNTKSSAGGQSLKDAIDEMNYYCSKNCPNGKVCKSNTPKCIRATTLHTETCTQTSTRDHCSASGYTASGSKGTTTITYGNTTTISGALVTGDAFDCDINGDGTFDPTTERFYYVSNYYDTTKKKYYDKVAVLIYYSSVIDGVANSSPSPYDCSGENNNGPVTAREELPTNAQWSNIRLYKDTRQILSYEDAIETSAGSLPKDFSYAGYSARLLTYQEAYIGCLSFNNMLSQGNGFLDNKCQFLLEGTKFSNSSLPSGLWLETPYRNSIDTTFVSTSMRSLHMGNSNANWNNCHNSFITYSSWFC